MKDILTFASVRLGDFRLVPAQGLKSQSVNGRKICMATSSCKKDNVEYERTLSSMKYKLIKKKKKIDGSGPK